MGAKRPSEILFIPWIRYHLGNRVQLIIRESILIVVAERKREGLSDSIGPVRLLIIDWRRCCAPYLTMASLTQQ